MEEIKTIMPRPVFQNPIMCPWVTCQPYPSTQLIKNKLTDFVKNHGSVLNTSFSKKSTCSSTTYNSYDHPSQQSSSTHFFYFLRLMQLFPDTHPATLHTVLTLSKNNFFYAIDKLLYAKKCKSNLNKRQNYTVKSTRGRGGYNSCGTRGRPTCRRTLPSYEPMPRTISDDLAEVHRLIGLAEKPYMEVQSISAEDTADQVHVEQKHDNGDNQQVLNICMSNPNQVMQGNSNFDAENQEVIEIVCFENDQQMIDQQKIEESMSFENFNDSEIQHEDRNNLEYKKDESEPSVIVVDTINDLNETGGTEQGSLVDSHETNHLNSAEFADNGRLAEEKRENDKS